MCLPLSVSKGTLMGLILRIIIALLVIIILITYAFGYAFGQDTTVEGWGQSPPSAASTQGDSAPSASSAQALQSQGRQTPSSDWHKTLAPPTTADAAKSAEPKRKSAVQKPKKPSPPKRLAKNISRSGGEPSADDKQEGEMISATDGKEEGAAESGLAVVGRAVPGVVGRGEPLGLTPAGSEEDETSSALAQPVQRLGASALQPVAQGGMATYKVSDLPQSNSTKPLPLNPLPSKNKQKKGQKKTSLPKDDWEKSALQALEDVRLEDEAEDKANSVAEALKAAPKVQRDKTGKLAVPEKTKKSDKSSEGEKSAAAKSASKRDVIFWKTLRQDDPAWKGKSANAKGAPATEGTSETLPKSAQRKEKGTDDAVQAKQAVANAQKNTVSLPWGKIDATFWKTAEGSTISSFLSRVEKGRKVLEGVRMSEQTGHLLRHVLLMPAEPFNPQTAGQKTSGADAAAGWAATRVRALNMLGLAKDAAGLLQEEKKAPPSGLYDQALQAFSVEQALLKGDTEQVCPQVYQTALAADDVFWHKALLVCQALRGEFEALTLSSEVMPVNVWETEPELPRALRMLQTLKTPTKPIPAALEKAGGSTVRTQTPSLLLQALYVAYPDLIKDRPLGGFSDTALRRLSANKAVPWQERAFAAEVLLNRSAMTRHDVKMLVGLYSAKAGNDRIVSAVDADTRSKQIKDGTLARSILWRAAMQSENEQNKAQMVQALWARAEKDGLWGAPLVLSPEAAGVKPSEKVAFLGPQAIRYALLANDVARAEQWGQALSAAESRITAAPQKRQAADAVLALKLVAGKVQKDDLTKWWETRSLKTPTARKETLRTLMVLEAQEVPVPETFWQQLRKAGSVTEEGKSPKAAEKTVMEMDSLWVRSLGAALDTGKEGEALLLTLEPLMQRPVAKLGGETAAACVTALKVLGLKDEALHLALEALLTTSVWES